MKLFFALLLMSTVLFCELSNIIDTSNSEICLLDISFEGESEKEASENIEDIHKDKFMQGFNFHLKSESRFCNDSSLKWMISTPYLEIHSPPPDLI